jgi:LacI family transcriptional regulator
MNKRVTIQDIADALGISRNTVSKAINNSEGLAEATRDRILQKAVEMGYKQFSYVTSIANLSLAKQENRPPQYQGEIALLTGTYLSFNHFGTLMMDRFQQELAELGYTLVTHRVTDENLASQTLPRTLISERAAGIVCIEMFDFAYGEMICDIGLPTLFIDGPHMANGKVLSADFLMMDNVSEITRFVNLMHGRGLQKIGFIGDIYHCRSFYERYLAYRQAMLIAKVDVDEKFIITTKDKDSRALEQALYALDEMPEVFICANDFIAIDAMQILAARNKQILHQVRFLGFDDSHESRIFDPAVSTVHIHTQAMSFSALHLLMTRIKEPSLDYRKIYVATNLILRESTDF